MRYSYFSFITRNFRLRARHGPRWSLCVSVALVASFLSLPACFMGKPGDLDQGGFVYVCTGSEDPFCADQVCDGMADCHLPSRIALGAKFGVWFDCAWSCSGQATSVSPELLSSAGGVFTANEEGRVALVGRNADGIIMDLIHVSIVQPSEVVIVEDGEGSPSTPRDPGARLTPIDSLVLAVGEQRGLRAASVDSYRRTLFGTLQTRWQSSALAVASFVSDTDDDQVTVVAVSPGTALLSVSIAGRRAEVEVTVEPGACAEDCDAWPLVTCCPDEDDVSPLCFDRAGQGPRCLRPCSLSLDCYTSSRCEPDGYCSPQPCGDPEIGIPGMIDHYCQVEGINDGQEGLCVGFLPRQSAAIRGGTCMETLGLDPGSPCDVPRDPLRLTRSRPRCALGLCVPATPGESAGICRQFCDWETAYDAAFFGGDHAAVLLPCGAGTSCVSHSSVSASTGLHELGYGLCLPNRSADPVTGREMCSLVTGGLINEPETRCASAIEHPHAYCAPVALTFEPDDLALGTLLGACEVSATPPSVALWSDCSAPGTVCPPNAWCVPQSAGLGDTGTTPRCAPLCDVEAFHETEAACPALIHAGNPDLTLDATPICVSLSRFGWFAPPGDLGSEDLFPTRLGLCQAQEGTP